MAEELAQVDVDDGPQHQDKLLVVGELPFEVTGGTKHGHHCSHSCKSKGQTVGNRHMRHSFLQL